MKRTLLAAIAALAVLVLLLPTGSAAAKPEVEGALVGMPSAFTVSKDRVFKPTLTAGAAEKVKVLATAGLVVKREDRKELRYEMRPAKAKIPAGGTKVLELRLPGSKKERKAATKKVAKALRHGGDGTLYVEVEFSGKGGASARITPQATLLG